MKRDRPPPMKARKRVAHRAATALHLHRLGFGFPNQVLTLDRMLAEPRRYRCRMSADIHGPQTYSFADPCTPSARIRDEFGRLREGQLPAFRTVAFDRASIVSRNLLLVPASRDCVVADSGVTPERLWRTLQEDALKLRPGKNLRGEYLLAVDRWSVHYYYHWMIETLSRFLALEHLGPRVKALIPRGAPSYMIRALELIGVGRDRLVEFDNRRWCVDCCHFATKPYSGFTVSPSEVCELRRRFHSAVEPAADGPGKVYISRGKCRHRRLANEHELAGTLSREGIATVYAEDLDLDQKIALLSRVDTVVAPFGSGLANLVFCRPGTHVICLYDEAFFDECVYTLSEALGLSSVHLPLNVDGTADIPSVVDAL